MNTSSQYRIDVIDSFKYLQESIVKLKNLLLVTDANLPAWFQQPKEYAMYTSISQRHQVLSFLSQLEYLDGQNPKEILVGPGVVAASKETIESIEAVNNAKDKFKAAMLKLKANKISTSDPYLNQQMEIHLKYESPDIRQTLKKIGLSRLHLKQCYRKIPIFYERPIKLAWTWANTRAINKISVEQALQLLEKHKRDYGIEQQILKLKSLKFTEPLAIVQDLAPHLRCNVVLPCNDNETKRIMIKGPVPIFYLNSGIQTLPDFKPPKEKTGRDSERPVRKDVKLDPIPFLPSIRAHRYY